MYSYWRGTYSGLLIFAWATTAQVIFTNPSSASCSQNEISISDSSVGNSCHTKVKNPPSCLPRNKLLVLDGNNWRHDHDLQMANPPTTKISSIDPSSRRSITSDAYEYVYVADAREKVGTGVVGVLASRFDETAGTYENLNLFQKSNRSLTIEVSQQKYKRYHEGDRIRMSRDFLKWRSIPDYSGVDDEKETRLQFQYDSSENADKSFRHTMLLRYTSGSVTCVGFKLAHKNKFSRAKITAFIDGDPASQDSINLQFPK